MKYLDLNGLTKFWLSVKAKLKTVAFTGNYNDLDNKPTSLPANGGNADTVDNKHASDFAAIEEVLTKTNTIEYTPTLPYHPTTKKFVEDFISESGGGDMLKSVYDTNNTGIVDNSERLGGKTAAELVPKDIVTHTSETQVEGSIFIDADLLNGKTADDLTIKNVVTYGDETNVDDIIPIDADLLNNKPASYYASKNLATETVNGLMSFVDKNKLLTIEPNANNYNHPSTHPTSVIEGLDSSLSTRKSFISRVIPNVKTNIEDYNTYYEIGKFRFTSMEGVITLSLAFNGNGHGSGAEYVIPLSYAMDFLTQYGISNIVNKWVTITPKSQMNRHVFISPNAWVLQAYILGNDITFRIVILTSTGQNFPATAYIKISHSNEFANCRYTELTEVGLIDTLELPYTIMPYIASGLNGTVRYGKNIVYDIDESCINAKSIGILSTDSERVVIDKNKTVEWDNKANKSDIIAFNGDATYTNGVIALMINNNGRSNYTVTFTAPSDCNVAHSYAINGTVVTLTDLNFEPLDDAWKQGSLVTLDVTGNKAFFKSGGGISVRKGVAEENLSSLANGSVNSDGTVSQRPISLISTLVDESGMVYKNLSFINQDDVLYCWGWTLMGGVAYLAKLHCSEDLSTLVLDAPLFATGCSGITSIEATSPNSCVILGLKSGITVFNIIYDGTIKILGSTYSISLGVAAGTRSVIKATDHENLYTIYYETGYNYNWDSPGGGSSNVGVGYRPDFGIYKWDSVGLKFTKISTIFNDSSDRNNPQIGFTYDKSKTQIVINYTRTWFGVTVQYSYNYTYYISISPTGGNGSFKTLAQNSWTGGDSTGNYLVAVNASDTVGEFFARHGWATSVASVAQRIVNGSMSPAGELDTYFGGTMIKYNTYFSEIREAMGGTPAKYSRTNKYFDIKDINQNPIYQTSRNPVSEIEYTYIQKANYICNYKTGSLLYDESTKKLYKYEGEESEVLILKETLQGQKVPYVKQSDLSKI